ncbi:MAG TPA: WhiB family transcriptional regulator [Arthrobacter sp.]
MRSFPAPAPNAPATASPADTGWRAWSACQEEDPELFFPTGQTGLAVMEIKEAKAVCCRCLVIEQCLQWALQTDQAHGVWGGLSESDRRRIKHSADRKRA